MQYSAKRVGGFTLIELIMVITITGILAGILVVFLKPAISSYFDTKRRGALTDMADTALRRMGQDIRSAVPNSLQLGSSTCFELVPTIAGGRYRVAPDTTQVSNSKWIDNTGSTSAFDVLGIVGARTPAAGDFVVINNQNSGDVYSGINRGTISGVTTPTGGVGASRITLATATQFPVGYNDGRFVVVPGTEATVTYTCSGTTLYRIATTTFGGAQCTPGATSPVVATNVNCGSSSFIYSPNQGATQQSGFILLELVLNSSTGDTVSLSSGVHVENLP
jgi:MSHA biogenesis protein MshO